VDGSGSISLRQLVLANVEIRLIDGDVGSSELYSESGITLLQFWCEILQSACMPIHVSCQQTCLKD